MSVFKRGDVWHYDFTDSRGDRQRGSTRQRSKAAALKVEARERQRAELGEAPRPIPTLREAADRWFAARADDKKSAATTAQRVEIMLRCMDAGALVTEIRTSDIEDAIQARRHEETHNKRAPTNSTVNRDLIDTTLRPILNYCRRVLDLPVVDPPWAALRLSEPKERSRAFTAAEIAAWRGALAERYRPLFDFMARYGVRLTEAFFPLDGFDADTATITLRQRKNGLPHIVRLLPEDAPDMTARFGRAREASLKHVWFHEAKSGIEPLRPGGFQKASRRALDLADVADARPAHDLRHHAATTFLRLPGANMKQVQRLLGHESITSTARYAHVEMDDVFETLRHASATVPGKAAAKG